MTKGSDMHEELIEQVEALRMNEQPSFFYLNGALANICALLYRSLPNLNWVGIYYLYEDDNLVLGPFHGEVACVTLPVGKGVCQKAVREKCVVRVDDVHQFSSHISCDSNSQSELVVPLFYHDKVVAVLDIDSSEKNHFTDELQSLFTEIGKILTTCFEATSNYLDILRINSHYIDSSIERDE